MIANEALRIIQQRRSTRRFADQQVTQEALQAVLEAGSCAPYAWEQVLHFAVVQNQALLDRLNHLAKETVKQLDIVPLRDLANIPDYSCLHHAPTLIIVSASERAPIPLEADCAAAMQNMLLAAEAVGLGGCWVHFVMMAFHSPQGPELRNELGIPESYKPYYAAVVGYKQATTDNAPARKPNLITYID